MLNMEEKKKHKGIIWLITILIVLILVLAGYIVYEKVLTDKKDIVDDNNITTIITTKKTDIKNEDDINFNDLVKLLKNYYINQEIQNENSDFYEDDNVEIWNIQNIKYLGYYEEQENIKYYIADGYFKCKDNGYTCIYMEQVDYETTDKIPFKAVFAIKQTDNKYEFDHMESQSFDDFLKSDYFSSGEFVLKEKIIQSNDSNY